MNKTGERNSIYEVRAFEPLFICGFTFCGFTFCILHFKVRQPPVSFHWRSRKNCQVERTSSIMSRSIRRPTVRPGLRIAWRISARAGPRNKGCRRSELMFQGASGAHRLMQPMKYPLAAAWLLQLPEVLRRYRLPWRRGCRRSPPLRFEGDARPVREVAVVADVDAHLGVARLEDRVPRLPGLKKNSPRNPRCGDMVFTVFSQIGSIGVDHGGGVVEHARLFLLEDGHDHHHLVLLAYRHAFCTVR